MSRKYALLVAAVALLLVGCKNAADSAEPTEPTSAPAAAVAPDEAVAPGDLAGQWEGAISILGQELNIVVRFYADGDALTASIDIPQQQAFELPLGGLTLSGNNIKFAIEAVGATFDGTVTGDTISGDFKQSVARGTFNLTRTGEALAPTPTPLPDYHAEELAWDLDDTKMTGTLTLPDGDGPFPAVLLIAGSGPTDRNWNSPLLPGTNGSAALLAEALTKAGYATLRYDKRVTGPNAAANLAALSGQISMQSHLDEVNSALAQLLAQPGVDPSRVFVLGNSEGTLHALNAQVTDSPPPFAGLILAAPPGRPLSDVLLEQVENNILAGDPNADTLLAGFRAALDQYLAGETPQPGPDWPPALQNLFAGLVAPANLPFARELMSVDPAALLAQVSAPVLVLIGEKDIQVNAQVDGPALEAAAGDNVTFVYPPNANHVLKLETTPADQLTAASATAYNAPDAVLDPDALQAILDWLAAQ